MPGIDKIIEAIGSGYDEKKRELTESARRQAEAIVTDARAQADGILSAADAEAAAERDRVIRAASSRAVADAKKDALAAKSALIDEAVESAVQTILEMPDDAYFDAFYALLLSSGATAGSLRFNARDLSRLPPSFCERLKKDFGGALTVDSNRPLDSKGGFVAECADSDFDYTLEALTQQCADELRFEAGRTLFGGE